MKKISSCDNLDNINGKPLENPKEISSTDRNSYILMEIIRQDTEWTVREKLLRVLYYPLLFLPGRPD